MQTAVGGEDTMSKRRASGLFLTVALMTGLLGGCVARVGKSGIIGGGEDPNHYSIIADAFLETPFFPFFAIYYAFVDPTMIIVTLPGITDAWWGEVGVP
jgi:hypothetical protein